MRHEVTQAQYEAVMNGIHLDLNADPSSFKGATVQWKASWEDAQIFTSV